MDRFQQSRPALHYPEPLQLHLHAQHDQLVRALPHRQLLGEGTEPHLCPHPFVAHRRILRVALDFPRVVRRRARPLRQGQPPEPEERIQPQPLQRQAGSRHLLPEEQQQLQGEECLGIRPHRQPADLPFRRTEVGDEGHQSLLHLQQPTLLLPCRLQPVDQPAQKCRIAHCRLFLLPPQVPLRPRTTAREHQRTAGGQHALPQDATSTTA